ncbi:hypothetical protein NONI108955_11755 [Nocardia ninae]|uniref:Uncharacterized protein n=1 Tax=Nocardia ninae NBRC 108245 TaxID=1210091 RepID=A0A511MR68_9NOCA|nr:hypothetical protein [Nocardia ninae]GEM42708.1 hypothetical protein NN4_72270 [Nocardia ninae NBRC 108245]
MAWNKRNRQLHRQLSIIFTTTVIVAFIGAALGLTETAMWLFYLPLPPLFLLMGTGLYMFAQPYRTKHRAARPNLAQ